VRDRKREKYRKRAQRENERNRVSSVCADVRFMFAALRITAKKS